MKVWWIAAILLVVTGVLSAQSDNIERQSQASTAYLAGDYETSQILYETIIQDGFRDFRIYFNLGNAYYESGDLGRALLNYRRAQEISPRDSDLGNNLARIRTERNDLQGDETGFTESLAALTIGVLNLAELSVLTLFIWIIWFVLLGAAIFKTVWLYNLRIPLIFVGIALLIGLCLLAGRLDTSRRHPPAVVTNEVITVHSGPGETYLELYQLHAAAEIYVWQMKDGWIQFALADGRLGWLPSSAVMIIQH